jgi:hypothetical protein
VGLKQPEVPDLQPSEAFSHPKTDADPEPALRGIASWHSLCDCLRLRRTGTNPGDYLPHVRLAAVFAKGEPANNGDNRIRTGDPLLAKQVLYQLSYVPSAMSPQAHRPK